MRFFLLFATLTLLFHVSFSQSEYRFQHFNTKDGLADDFVFSLAQDSLGYIWLQYYGGLTRFDGYNFKVYKYDQDDRRRSSLDFLLGRLMLDANKNMWIPKHGHPQIPPFTIAKYDPKTDGFVKFVVNLEMNFVNRFRLGKDNRTLWLSMDAGRGLHSLNMETKEIDNYLNPSSNKDAYIQQNSLYDSEDMESSILLATKKGLWSFEKTKETFRRPTCNPKDSAFLYNTPFFYIYPDKNFWLFFPGGLVKLGPDLSVLQRNGFPPNFNMSSFGLDADGVFWFGTWDQGLYRFDPNDSSFINIRNVPGDDYSLRSNSVNDVMVDRDQNIWVASAKGVSKLHRKNLEFTNVDLQVSGSTIYKTKEKDFLVIGKFDPITQSKGIFMAPILPGNLTALQFQPILTHVPGNDMPRFYKGKRYFWISTNAGGKGIFGLPINPKSEMIEPGPPLRIVNVPDNPKTIGSDQVRAVWEDLEENLWAGTDAGLSKVNLRIPYGEEGSVVTYKHLDADTNSIHVNTVNQMYPENERSFWVLDSKGADLFHRDSQHFEHVFKNREIADNLYKTSDGTLFLGTIKGLYEAKKINGHYVVEATPLWNKAEVTAIQEDRLGRLWLYSRSGLVCYDRKEKIAIEFDEVDGARHAHSIERGHFHQTSQGIMVVDDPEGLSFFNPMMLKIDRKKANAVLTKLVVSNEAPYIGNLDSGDDDFYITKDISLLDELTIDYRHNDFTIEFSAMEMTAPEKNLYQYKLEGYNEGWIETDFRNRAATYTNLDAGHYTFKVKASNHHGIWSDHETTLSVVVLPPPWKTWWAYSGYGLLVGGLLFLARRNIVQRERLKSNLKLAKVEKEKEHFELEKAKEVDKVKSAFFTNISHEFRTPLTLIKGPVHDLLEEFADHPVVKERLKLVQRNADLLLKLINQLLDLAKLETGSLTVDRTEGDLNLFLSAVTGSFSSLAIQKGITLSSELASTRYLALFDKDKLETILINLINNAIKFTRAGGSVKVRVGIQKVDHQKNVDQLILTVSDTGIGIPENQQIRVFERFYQVSEAHKEAGTGIGLSLVKELITLLGGTISLKSEPGKGSEFNVTVPIELTGTVREVGQIRGIAEGSGTEQNISRATFLDTKEGELPRVLVVEDNSDLRNFIIDSLGKEFCFLEAADGKQGMAVAFEEVPDLIISDIMMPELDGITMTGKLKKDTRTSHVPIILLTAKASEDSKLSGLSTGADDYLTKPFNKNELILKVRNSISLRIKLREKIRLELLKESPKVEVQSADEQFLWKVKQAILGRLGDEQLSVESLSEEIGLSRSQLFRKISSLTGVSVNELIRTFRLQKAAQLLEQSWGPVTQVAYEVGFSNLSYFSKVFKEQYGVLPSEYPGNKKHDEKISPPTNGNEIVNSEESKTAISTNAKQEDPHQIEASGPDQQAVILVVEDNVDMRNYIKSTLSGTYQIIEAENGREGENKAKESVPDLIISDIMMPEMDGYMLCECIKTKELTSHIPVILLTAKADRESKLTGLETGADDYLTKPFDTEELKLIVRNRIEQRRKTREHFSQGIIFEPKQISITSMDEKFLSKVLGIIETHMDDEHFSIEDFSREVGYSHMNFYRKIKALSGQSPSLFLRTIRLKRAADLLSKKSDKVSQIAYSVGFSSLSYFNKCFKEQFGVTPGQFAATKQTTT